MSSSTPALRDIAPTRRQIGTLTPRGEQRRETLVAAALRIIVRDGPGAATLRTVATEAQASHGSVVYYFGTREELIRAALHQVAARNIEALQQAWQAVDRTIIDPHQLAGFIAHHSARQMVDDRSMGITIVELHLAAARFPALRPNVREWGRAYARISRETFARLGSSDPAADSAILTSLISGLVVGQLAIPRKDFETAILQPAIERFLGSVGSAPKRRAS